MVVGFFDSGLGGKLVSEVFQHAYPDMTVLLKMDREHAPYGGKAHQEIRDLTYLCVQELFDMGADVVILACNTASVVALRWLQQEAFPDRHILGVTVPGAEAVVEGGYKHVGVLATEATVKTRMYKERVAILDEGVHVDEVSAPGLVPLIEEGKIGFSDVQFLLREYLSQFSPDMEALVLGCTHYPLVRPHIETVWREVHQTVYVPVIIDPGVEATKKFLPWAIRKGFSV